MDKTIGKTDRRIQRTRQALRDALLELVTERGYDNINIQDITDRANIARTTFYLHFDDKDDLLFSSMAELYRDLFARATNNATKPLDELMGSSDDFEHVAQYADFYKVMLSENGSMRFTVRVQQFLAEMMKTHILQPMLPPGQTPSVPLDVLAAFIAGAQIGVLTWWVNHNMPYDAATMGRMTEDVCLKGLTYILSGTDNA